MKKTHLRSAVVAGCCLFLATFGLWQIGSTVLAEQAGSSPESGATSRIKTIYDSLVSLGYGSDSAGSWGDWGSMWNRIRSAGEWMPTGNATPDQVVSGATFYKDSRTPETGALTLTGDATASDVAFGKTFYSSDLTKQTGSYCSSTLTECGECFQVTHQVADGVAPVDKTVNYQTVSTDIGGTGTKCWITQNLGATRQATSATDATEDSAGWYWQFNRKQGYKHDGTTRTPDTAWDATNDNTYTGWDPAKDPCALELGSAWRLPTYAEYLAADGNPQNWANYNDTYASVLKLHTAGYLGNTSGALNFRWANGQYWSSTQYSTTEGRGFAITPSTSNTGYASKSWGFSVRCLRDP